MVSPINYSFAPQELPLSQTNSSTEQIQKIHLVALSILFIIGSLFLLSKEIAIPVSIGIGFLSLSYFALLSIFKENNQPLPEPSFALTPFQTSQQIDPYFAFQMTPYNFYPPFARNYPPICYPFPS